MMEGYSLDNINRIKNMDMANTFGQIKELILDIGTKANSMV